MICPKTRRFRAKDCPNRHRWTDHRFPEWSAQDLHVPAAIIGLICRRAIATARRVAWMLGPSFKIATYATCERSQPPNRLAICFSGFLATPIRSHRMSCIPCETDSAIHASQFNTKSFDDQAFFTGRFASHRATWIPPFSGPANDLTRFIPASYAGTLNRRDHDPI